MAVFSHEVRWFFDGSLVDTGKGVERWFRESDAPGWGGKRGKVDWPADWRCDCYLIVPDASDMGLKWREEQLQIKGREATLGVQQFAPGMTGIAERWLRWSYAGDAVESRFGDWFLSSPGADSGVVRVDKRRIQRRFRLDLSGRCVEIPTGTPIDRGIDAELVRIRLDGSGAETHWSLGFEAFPADSAMHEQFARITGSFLDGVPISPLCSDRSMSYPEWLQRMRQACPEFGLHGREPNGCGLP